MQLRRTLAVLSAIAATIALTATPGNAATPQPANRAAQLQQSVNAHLAQLPGWYQISADTIATKGATATIAAPGDVTSNSVPSCANYYLCVKTPNGTVYRYYYCGLYEFWGIGDGWFNNNQSSGTVARFYNYDGSLRWTNRAKDTGTASWTPVYYIRPC